MQPTLDSLDQMNRDLLAAHEGILARMSPAEKRSPAVFQMDSARLSHDPFAPMPRMQGLFQPNPAFFDSSMPRGEVQLLMFDLFGNGETTIQFAGPRIPRYHQQLLRE